LFENSLKRIEPIIENFEKEGVALINLGHNLSHFEKMDFVRRSHTAKEYMLLFNEEIDNKSIFLKDLL
jgi:hypothetical protein